MQARGISWKVISSFAFVLTAVGVVLPGALLPALLTSRHLSDARGGLLLMVLSGTSTVSMLLVRNSPRRTASAGIAITAAALLGLAFGSSRAMLPLFSLYGCGLGLAMTGINICRGRDVPEIECGAEMNRLNMLWAAGACVTPFLALHALRTVRVTATFAFVGVVFAAASAVLGWKALQLESVVQSQDLRRSLTRQVPVVFCVFAALAVGAESCIGAWLTAYVTRAGHAAGWAVSANTLFWTGLLLSRAMHAHLSFGWLRTPHGMRMQLFITAAGAILLLAARGNPGLLSAALLSGIGIGPLYPSLLAMVIPRYRSNFVFVCAGAAAAVLPWVFGEVSSATGSVHQGFWVVGIAVALLMLTAAVMHRGLAGAAVSKETAALAR